VEQPKLICEDSYSVMGIGGIYTDIDNAPGPKFQNATVMKDSDEAWFVIKSIGLISHYFIAALPKHLYVYIAILSLLHRVLDVKEIGNQYLRKSIRA
jgi:mannosyltransferase OCH1-like enzyme